MLLFARRSTTPTTATRYCGPRRGQGRSSSRGLHLDRGCGPPVSGSGGGPADNRRSTRAGGDTVDTFIRGVAQLSDRQREEPVAESRTAVVRPEFVSTWVA